MAVEGEPVVFSLWDTSGTEPYYRIRALNYQSTDVFLLLFSVAHHSSFASVTETWLPEVSSLAQAVLYVVIFAFLALLLTYCFI